MASVSNIDHELMVFTGQNYILWKNLLRDVLKSEGLYAVAFDGTPNPATDEEKEEWLAADKKAKEIILSYLYPEHLRLVEGCQHSRDILDKLDTTQKMVAEENFSTYKMRSGDRIEEHVATVEELAKEVQDAGGEMSEVMVMDKILESLSRKFHRAREAWLSSSGENNTLKDLKDALLMEEKNILERKRFERIYFERKFGFNHERCVRHVPYIRPTSSWTSTTSSSQSQG